MDLTKLINRVYVLLCIYEEQSETEDIVSDKIIHVINDLFSFGSAYKDILDKDDYDRVIKSANVINLLNENPFYSNNKKIVRKVILDITGDLARIKTKFEDLI